MIDYIAATKYRCKDKPFFGHCKLIGIDGPSGVETYILQGCGRMRVKYSKQNNILKLCGSLPYFLKGHNFSFLPEEFVEAVGMVDSMLGGIDLWGADLDVFEFGAIVPVDAKPKDFIANHYSQDNSLKLAINEQYAGKFALWRSPRADLKMYDAGANIQMKQGFARRAVMEGEGYDPNKKYIKFEVRYKQPTALNGGRLVQVEALQNEEFKERLKSDYMEKYHTLTPARGLVLPSNKKDFNSLDAVLITLAETLQGDMNNPLEAAKQKIFNTINQVECLSKSDKDARKAQIRKAFSKLSESPESRWDLTKKLECALME